MSRRERNLIIHLNKECLLFINTIRYVDKIIPEYSWDQKIDDIVKYKIDIFVMGDDWKGKFDYLKEYCDVIYLPRTEGISTSQIKKI